MKLLLNLFRNHSPIIGCLLGVAVGGWFYDNGFSVLTFLMFIWLGILGGFAIFINYTKRKHRKAAKAIRETAIRRLEEVQIAADEARVNVLRRLQEIQRTVDESRTRTRTRTLSVYPDEAIHIPSPEPDPPTKEVRSLIIIDKGVDS